MASATGKADRLIKAIGDEIALKFPTAVLTYGYDANIDATLDIALASNTHRLRIKPEAAPASGATDGLGLTQRVYVPYVIQFARDTTAAADALQYYFSALLASKGARVEFYTKATPAYADMTGPTATNFITQYQFQGADVWGYLSNQ